MLDNIFELLQPAAKRAQFAPQFIDLLPHCRQIFRLPWKMP